MKIFLAINVLILSGIFWYFFYGLECYMNGAGGGFFMPFRCLWDDFRFNMPGGWKRRLKAARGNVEWAKAFSGPIHFLCMHILLPFGLFFLVLLLV